MDMGGAGSTTDVALSVRFRSLSTPLGNEQGPCVCTYICTPPVRVTQSYGRANARTNERIVGAAESRSEGWRGAECLWFRGPGGGNEERIGEAGVRACTYVRGLLHTLNFFSLSCWLLMAVSQWRGFGEKGGRGVE